MIFIGICNNILHSPNTTRRKELEEKNNQKNQIIQVVREKYGDLAEKQMEKPGSESCCSSDGCGCALTNELSEEITHLYAAEEINDLPETVTGILLGCGNPTAIADLALGQTVLDLGSGGGIDCFLAAKKVGPMGRVIGLDMTPKMIDLARSNAKKQGFQNVEFRYGYIEDIPLPDASVDVIISNCVINLSADKDAVFRETYRVLKSGAVLNISDIVTNGDLPDALVRQLSAWVGCVSGALDEEVYLEKMREAGFKDIEIIERKYYSTDMIVAIKGVQDIMKENRLDLVDLEKKVASITLRAVKETNHC